MSHFRSGFTLIELLLVIANIGVLAGIVIMAINPAQQVTAAQDAKRSANIRALEGAIEQYYLDEGIYPGDEAIPYGYDSRVNICQNGATGTGCIQLDVIVTDTRNYLGAPEIPVDPSNTNDTITGYSVYLDELSRPRVVSEYAGTNSTENESGTFAGGDGSGGNPWQIANCTQLQNIDDTSQDPNAEVANFILTGHIDCADTVNWNSGAGFDPLFDGDLFAGTLDGNGYTIRNLYVNRPSDTLVGLFGKLDSSTFTDLGIINATVIGGTNRAGILAGDGTADYVNVYTTGSVTGTNYAGGIAGSMGGGFDCLNCYSTATVSGVLGGGITGFLGNSDITNSFATGNIEGSTAAGGLAGQKTTGTISNSYWFDNNGDDAISCYSGGTTGCTEINAGNGGITYFYNSSNPPLSSWNFSTVWRENGATFPTLR